MQGLSVIPSSIFVPSHIPSHNCNSDPRNYFPRNCENPLRILQKNHSFSPLSIFSPSKHLSHHKCNRTQKSFSLKASSSGNFFNKILLYCLCLVRLVRIGNVHQKFIRRSFGLGADRTQNWITITKVFCCHSQILFRKFVCFLGIDITWYGDLGQRVWKSREI